MSGAYGHIRGTIFKSPETKQSKSGNVYANATLRVKDGTETKFWRLMAFKGSSDALLQFNEGDFIEAQGSIKCEAFTKKDGSTAVGFTMLANSVEAYSPPEKKPQSTAQGVSTGGSSLMQRYGEYRV